MSDIFFEKEHRSIGSFPYIELINEDLDFISHYHEELEVVYIESGTISAFSGAKEILLQKGDICIFMPDEIHSFQTITSNNLYVIKLNLSSYVEHVAFEKIRLKNNKISPKDACYPLFKRLVDELCEEYIKKETGYEFAIRHCKNQMILHILRNLEYEVTDTSKNIELLNLINQYLEEKFEGKITLGEVAKYCHFSKYYFAHKVKEMTGITFVQYLTAFRLERAVRLLSNTDMRITDIALNCGFCNLRSFNRIFSAMYKMTPSTYRKHMQKSVG